MIPYRQMSCQAPRRCSHEHPGGTWTYHPWTVEDVKAYKAIGGWFIKGYHEFADRAAAIAAGVSPELEDKQLRHAANYEHGYEKLARAYNKLTAEEQADLLEKLK